MLKWLKPYKLVQKLNDYKRKNIVCTAHMDTKYANTGGLGHDAPEKFEKFWPLLLHLHGTNLQDYSTSSKIIHITSVI